MAFSDGKRKNKANKTNQPNKPKRSDKKGHDLDLRAFCE